jgi:hypothetical protein
MTILDFRGAPPSATEGGADLPPTAPPYQPALTEAERRAYQAAHRIVAADLRFDRLASPGARRSRAVDAVAKMIVEAMG